MAHRRSLLAIILLAACLHAIGIARTLLPAQDGLKLIRFARAFQTEHWTDAVRGADVHPLYPALIAMAEPPVAWMVGEGPEAWRLAAQLLATLASLGLIVPVYFLTERLFDRRIAFIAAGVLALLPRVAEAGHETLADSVGLFTTFMALWLAALSFRTGDWRLAIGSGLFSALGYLARPEVILVPATIGLTWLASLTIEWRTADTSPKRQRVHLPRMLRKHALPVASGSYGHLVAIALMLALPAIGVAGYAAVKGEVSEKLSVRTGAWLGPQKILRRPVPQQVPPGLDDPRWDFSAKEESDHLAIRGARQAVRRIFGRWWEEMAWFFAVMTVWGWARRKSIRGMVAIGDGPTDPGVEGLLLGLFAGVYTIALVRHSTVLGYLSGRHILPLVVASIPWAAGGTYICCRRIGELLHLKPRPSAAARLAAIGFALILSVSVQWNPQHLHHLSRWGHWAAGRWLSAHAAPGEEVLDTRGWARFISGLPGYDYWHVRQALTDSHLSYILVGLDELRASSGRAETLRALLAYAGTPVLDFPASPGDPTPAVRIYRFRRPTTWEGFAR